MARKTIARIHVNQHNIKRNKKTGSNLPVLTIKRNKMNTYAHEIEIKGPSKIVYAPEHPLSCGARCWIETTAEIEVKR